MPRPWVVQTPTPAEYPQLAQLWEASVRATHDFLPDSYITVLRELVENRYLGAVLLLCCRDADGQLTGFAGVAMGKVEMLFIAPEYRGQGVGKALLSYAVEQLQAEELDVNEQNPQAWFRGDRAQPRGRHGPALPAAAPAPAGGRAAICAGLTGAGRLH